VNASSVKHVKPPNVSVDAELRAALKALTPASKRLAKALGMLDPSRLQFGAAADLLYELRGLGKQLGALSAPFDDVLGPAIKALEEHFVNSLKVGEASGVQGFAARVQVTDNPVPVVKNWAKFYEHIRKTKSFELLNRAVNRAAVKERWDMKKQVPGVDVFHAKNVSCTKLSGKSKVGG
jgi:hypothetical protein